MSLYDNLARLQRQQLGGAGGLHAFPSFIWLLATMLLLLLLLRGLGGRDKIFLCAYGVYLRFSLFVKRCVKKAVQFQMMLLLAMGELDSLDMLFLFHFLVSFNVY